MVLRGDQCSMLSPNGTVRQTPDPSELLWVGIEKKTQKPTKMQTIYNSAANYSISLKFGRF